jgi:LPS export ABC transporter protein LptC
MPLIDRRIGPVLRRVPLALPMVVVVLLAACGDRDAETPAAATQVEPDPTVPEQKFYDYRLIETRAGVRQWVLDSDEMLKYADRRDVDLVRVKMDFFQDGAYYSTLVSDSGTADLESNDVTVWGHVVITTHDGRRLRCSILHYTNEDGLIRNDVYNVIDRGADVITGIGLEATPDLDYIELKEEVAAEVGDDTASEAEAGGDSP